MFRNFTTDKFGRASFEIHDVDLSLVNSIRRIILSDIPVVAFDGEENPSLTVHTNTGPLHNEYILHRFGLVPIHFNDNETEEFSQDDYTFELHASNDTQSTINVTSKDITVKKNGVALTAKEINRLFPANNVTKEYLLITRLRKGEELRVSGNAVKNFARYHAGFSPVSLCNFRYIQDPALAAKASGVLDKERAYQRNEHGEPTSFIFDIETETGLSVQYLLPKALNVLVEKLNKLINGIPDNMEKPDSGPGFVFSVQDEDDTLGNFIQSTMFNHYIRDSNALTADNKRVTYVGYYCPHPLDRVVKMKVCIENEDAPAAYIDVIQEHCRRCITYIDNIIGEWKSVA